MKSPQGILAGKKTYVTAVASIVGAVGAYLTGEATFMELYQVVSMSLTAVFMRKGIAAKGIAAK